MKPAKISIYLNGEEEPRDYQADWVYDINGPQFRGFVRVWRRKETHFYPIDKIRLVITRND